MNFLRISFKKWKNPFCCNWFQNILNFLDTETSFGLKSKSTSQNFKMLLKKNQYKIVETKNTQKSMKKRSKVSEQMLFFHSRKNSSVKSPWPRTNKSHKILKNYVFLICCQVQDDYPEDEHLDRIEWRLRIRRSLSSNSDKKDETMIIWHEWNKMKMLKIIEFK